MTSTPLTMTPTTERAPESWLHRTLIPGLTPARLILLAIMALALFLNLYRLDEIGDGNLYYTAAVESMLQSWHNFFFVAAEPGASLSVDKPPLGLWLEAAAAFVLGVNGLAVALPNILAGVTAVPVLYRLTQRYIGTGGALVAALVLAITPVAVAAQRNNTMDSMLTLALLLAAWAFLRAAETGRLRFLMWGAVIIGLGFNIKMLQAFLPVPALYAVYWLGSRHEWRRKLAHLAAATAVLLVVSLAWVAAVDLTPASARPYVGSSTDNRVTELIIGHNGISRLVGVADGRQLQADAGPNDARSDDAPGVPPNMGSLPPPPAGGLRPPQPGSDGMRPPLPGGAPGGSAEVGDAGVLRFWQAPLSKELSWLLPLALAGGLLLLLSTRLSWPLAARHRYLLVFGGWLAIGLLFFSFAGFFHAYYLVMLAPPLAALAGGAAAELWQWRQTRPAMATGVLLAVTAVTLLYQWWNAAQFVAAQPWLLAAGLLAAAGGAVWMWRGSSPVRAQVGLTLLLAAMLVTPLVWSYQTTTHVTNVNLPAAYGGETAVPLPGAGDDRSADPELLAYLQANTPDEAYLLAVPSSMQGAPYVLASGRPVLYMGGFSGSDPVVTVDDLAQMTATGDLRYILLDTGGRQTPGGAGDATLQTWVTSTCTAVPAFTGLFDCLK